MFDSLAAGGNSTRVIGSITDALLLSADSAKVDDLLRSAAVGVVTLTVTERATTGGPTTGYWTPRHPRSRPISPAATTVQRKQAL